MKKKIRALYHLNTTCWVLADSDVSLSFPGNDKNGLSRAYLLCHRSKHPLYLLSQRQPLYKNDGDITISDRVGKREKLRQRLTQRQRNKKTD